MGLIGQTNDPHTLIIVPGETLQAGGNLGFEEKINEKLAVLSKDSNLSVSVPFAMCPTTYSFDTIISSGGAFTGGAGVPATGDGGCGLLLSTDGYN